MQLFYIERNNITVASGVIFDNGKCVVSWTGEHSSTVVWESLTSMMKINGTGQTQFYFTDYIIRSENSTEILWNIGPGQRDEMM